jgi:hypothetical protein
VVLKAHHGGDVRKDQQQTVGAKASAKEIDGVFRIEEESLSETPNAAPTQSAKQPTNQTNKTRKKKTTVKQRLGRRGTKEVRHKRGKKGRKEGGETPHKG